MEKDTAIDRTQTLFGVCSSNGSRDTQNPQKNGENSGVGAGATDVCKVGVVLLQLNIRASVVARRMAQRRVQNFALHNQAQTDYTRSF